MLLLIRCNETARCEGVWGSVREVKAEERTGEEERTWTSQWQISEARQYLYQLLLGELVSLLTEIWTQGLVDEQQELAQEEPCQ